MPRSARTNSIFVSSGEPSGIGTDILLQAWDKMDKGEIARLPIIYVGDKDHLHSRAEQLKISCSYSIDIHQIKNKVIGKAGEPNLSDYDAIIESLTTCVELITKGEGGALVTLPIHKKTLYESGFEYAGHTEYLAHLTDSKTPIMMLCNSQLRIVPLTIHIPLSQVSDTITSEKIIESSIIIANELSQRFGISNPRLAYAGLNPHSGEGGTIGKQELDIIIPALEKLKLQGIDCLGPLSADTMFHPEARQNYDVAICMYHDQALIPIKTIDFHGTVNLTLGLPIIRTSPDHGTALDIAGTGRANPTSFINALSLANDLAQK